MAIENVELMHECCPNTCTLEKTKMKYDKETEEEDKHNIVNMERSNLARNKVVPKELPFSNQ